MGLFGAIGYNLANLLNFKGRATRSQFWPYVAFVFFLSFAGMGAIMLPEMAASMEQMQQFSKDHPEQATVRQGPGHYSITIHGYHPELMPDFNRVVSLTFIGVAAIILLLAAAVARRLHDRGKSGAWGLMPLPFLGFASALMPMLFAQIGQGEPDPSSFMGWFFALFINNLLYLVSLVFLVVLLCGASTKGENRYGG